MYIGIDLGTSGVKVILIDEQQKIIATQTEAISISRPHALWSEQDPLEWWQATDNAMLKLKQQFNLADVKAIGLSGQMHGATLLDKSGDVLRPAILWNDGRSVTQCKELELIAPKSRHITGNLMMPGFTAPKLKWVEENEPEIFKKIDKVLLPKDYLRFRMTGEFASDMSDASGTMWLDVQQRSWSETMLSACHLTTLQMPKLYEGSAITGYLLPSVAERWGMKSVAIAAGGGDNAAGAIGVGLHQQGQAMLSLGTSGVYFVVTDRFYSNAEQAVHSFCHAVPNSWHLMSVMLSAASCLDWAAKILNIANVTELLKQIEQINYKTDPIYFLPYLSGERTPHNNAYAKGMFFGLTHQHTSADLAKAVLEGVSYALADCMDILHKTGVTASQIYVIGGGAKSAFWNQLLSDISGHSLIYSEGGNIGPALGAAKLAQIAINPHIAIEQILQAPQIIQTFSPNKPQYDFYQERRKLFNQLYRQTESLLKYDLE